MAAPPKLTGDKDKEKPGSTGVDTPDQRFIPLDPREKYGFDNKKAQEMYDRLQQEALAKQHAKVKDGKKASGGHNNDGVHNPNQKQDTAKWRGCHATSQKTGSTLTKDGGHASTDGDRAVCSSGTAQATPGIAGFLKKATDFLGVMQKAQQAHDAYMEGDYRTSINKALDLMDQYHTHADPNGPSAYTSQQEGQTANRSMDPPGSANISESQADDIADQFVYDQLTRGTNEPLALMAKEQYLQSVSRSQAMLVG